MTDTKTPYRTTMQAKVQGSAAAAMAASPACPCAQGRASLAAGSMATMRLQSAERACGPETLQAATAGHYPSRRCHPLTGFAMQARREHRH